MAPSASQALLFDVHYDSVFFFSPLRYEHGLTLQLRVTNDNRLDFSSVSEHLRERAQQNLYAMFYVIPECDLEKAEFYHKNLLLIESRDEETARFQRPDSIKPSLDPKPHASHNGAMENPNPNPKNTTRNSTNVPTGKPSFVSVVHGSTKSSANTSQPVKPHTVSLIDQDLIRIDDATRLILVKLKDIESMSNMHLICKDEGFVDLKIHHIGGLWIWIQFPTPDACVSFQYNESLKHYYSSYTYASPSFNIDERLIWIEINGLPLCAWGSSAFKKVACLFGKFMFFESEQSASMCSGRVCISTKTHKFISEKVDVEIHGEIFEVNVHKLGTWSINIVDENDNSQDSASSEDENELEKVADTFDDNLADDTEDIIKDLAVDKDEEVVLEKSPEDVNGDLEFPLNESGNPTLQSQKEENLSDLSCPPASSI
ncbi:hypothetical protein Tco_0465658 [Tanacetum coccineum]